MFGASYLLIHTLYKIIIMPVATQLLDACTTIIQNELHIYISGGGGGGGGGSVSLCVCLLPGM